MSEVVGPPFRGWSFHCSVMFMIVYINVGPPSVTSLSVVESSNNSVFTLNCVSNDSPATIVTWTKDGEVMADSATYQTMMDGLTATYDSFLEIQADADDLVGTYSCSVLNSAGQSNEESLDIKGKLTALANRVQNSAYKILTICYLTTLT